MYQNLALILTFLTSLNTSDGCTSEHDNKYKYNPYALYDEREKDFRIIKTNKEEKYLFGNNQIQKYQDFQKNSNIIQLEGNYNDINKYSTVIQQKLLDFFIIQQKQWFFEFDKDKIENPFIIDKNEKDSLTNIQLSQYIPSNLSFTLRLKKHIQSAEILDIFSNEPLIIPDVCHYTSQIQGPSCEEKLPSTSWDKRYVTVKFKIFPTKEGRYQHKLYLLVRIQKIYNVIVTVEGSYEVKPNQNLKLFLNKNLFKVQIGDYSHAHIYLQNKSDTDIQVKSFAGYGDYLQINYPKDFKDNPEEQKKEKQDDTTNWIISPGESKPVMEIFMEVSKFPQCSKNISKKLCQNKIYANVLEVVIGNDLFYFSFFNYFVKDQSIFNSNFLNFGVFTSRDVYHEIPIYLSSKQQVPVFLNNVKIEVENEDFEIIMSSFYKHAIALPFQGQNLMLFRLLVRYQGNQNFAQLKGTLQAKYDQYDFLKEEQIEFSAIYAPDFLQIKSLEQNIITEKQREFHIQVFQRTNSSLKLDYLVILGDKQYGRYFTLSKRKEITKLSQQKFETIYTITFKQPNEIDKYYEQLPFKLSFTMVLKTFENIFTKKIDFYFKILGCSINKNMNYIYRFCGSRQWNLDYGYFTPKYRKKVKSFFIKNFSTNSHVIQYIKFTNVNSYNIKLDFIRHQKYVQDNINQSYDICPASKSQCSKNFQIELKKNKNQIHPGDIFELKIEINILENSKIEQEKQETISNIYIFTEEGFYKCQMNFKFIKGNLELIPKTVYKNIIYPFQSELITISALSTYDETIKLNYPAHKSGNGSNLVGMIDYNRNMKKGITEKFLQFRIDPEQVSFPEEHMFSQKNHTSSELCLYDIDIQNNNEKLFQKIIKDYGKNFDVKINISTQWKEDLSVNIKGKIIQGKILEKDLDLGIVSDQQKSYHDLSLSNPYESEIEVELYIVHKKLLDLNRIDKQIISQIQENEGYKEENTLCITNQHMSLETLVYYAHKIYSNKLVYLPKMKPETKNRNKYACFKIPEEDKEQELLYIKITSLSNFFFEFVQQRQKKTYLSEKIIILDDIENFNFHYRQQEVDDEKEQKFELNQYILQFLWGRINNKLNQQNEIKRIKNRQYRYVKYTNDLDELIQNKEIFLQKDLLKKKIKLQPLQSLKIKDAIYIDPKKVDSDKDNEMVSNYYLLIKNNLTKLEKYQIQYNKVPTQIALYDLNDKKIQDNLITIEIKYDNNQKNNMKNTILKYYFVLKNENNHQHFIKSIHLKKTKSIEECIQIPQILPGYNNNKIILIYFIPCKRILTDFSSILVIETKDLKIEYKLDFLFNQFYIEKQYSKQEISIMKKILILICSLLIIFWLKKIKNNFQKKKNYQISKKINMAKFLSEINLEKNLKYHQTAINLKVQQQRNIKLKEQIQKGNFDQDISQDNQIDNYLSKILGKNKALKNFDYNRNIFSNISNNVPVDNSNHSIENFYRMLDTSKQLSLSDSNSEMSKNDSQIIENESDQSLTDLMGQKSFREKQELSFKHQMADPRKISNREQFINALIIEQKLNQDSEEYSSNKINDKKEEFEEDKSFFNLDKVFSNQPYEKRNLSINSQEYIQEKSEQKDQQIILKIKILKKD